MEKYRYNEVEIVLNEIRDKIKSGEMTQEWLENIVSQVSVVDDEGVSGKKTVSNFYSGAAAEDMSRYRTIGNTTASDLLNSPDFFGIIKNILSEVNPQADKLTIEKWTYNYINGTEIFENFKPTGIESKGTTGPWAIVSRNFAIDTTGDVILRIGNIDDVINRIWWNTEMPALITESKATSINGVPMINYRFLYNQFSNTDTALDRIGYIIATVPIDNTNPDYW